MPTVILGDWDGDERSVTVEDGATLSDVLSAAGITIQNSQTLTTFSNAQNVSLNDEAVDGETYLLTANHQGAY